MSLIEHRPEGMLRIRWVREEAIGVEDTVIEQSFLLADTRLVADWPVATVGDINEAAISAILALQPELVLLGSGSRQRFPTQQVMAEFLRRQIGFEVMDNAAAARTYHLLTQEGRRVVAAFILGSTGE